MPCRKAGFTKAACEVRASPGKRASPCAPNNELLDSTVGEIWNKSSCQKKSIVPMCSTQELSDLKERNQKAGAVSAEFFDSRGVPFRMFPREFFEGGPQGLKTKALQIFRGFQGSRTVLEPRQQRSPTKICRAWSSWAESESQRGHSWVQVRRIFKPSKSSNRLSMKGQRVELQDGRTLEQR